MPFIPTYTPEPTRPSGGPQPGTQRLYDFILRQWPAVHGLGIYNPRDICGNPWPKWRCKGSQHARGAAGDSGVEVSSAGKRVGDLAAAWLVAHNLDLGIQEVIWYRRRWTNQTNRWTAYNGPSPHVDHVHWAQHSTAASRLTDAQIRAVKPGAPSPTPSPVPVPQEDLVYTVISPKNFTWLIEPGIMTLIPAEDKDNLTAAKIPALGKVSATLFARIDAGHERIEG